MGSLLVQLFMGLVNSEIGKPYGLEHMQVCELVRVALRAHVWPVSRMLAISVRMIKCKFPGLRIIVSFADTAQGHHGGIYQSSGWIYTGSQEYHAYRVLGRVVHPRVLHHLYGKGGQSIPWLRQHIDPNAERIANGTKHKYVYPLDEEMKQRILPLSKPYPKKPRATSIEGDASSDPTGRGGINATVALQEVSNA